MFICKILVHIYVNISFGFIKIYTQDIRRESDKTVSRLFIYIHTNFERVTNLVIHQK